MTFSSSTILEDTNHEVGLLSDDQRRATFVKRAKILSNIRQFLEHRNFLEVETPILVWAPVMAPVRDYVISEPRIGEKAYLRTTNTDLMRRLVLAGFDRIYQIGKNFRDEELSFKRYAEFTMLTFGLAYATYNNIMSLVEELVGYVAMQTNGTTVVKFQGHELDLAPPWPRLSMRQAIQTYTGIDLDDHQSEASLKRSVIERGINVPANALHEEIIDISCRVGPSFGLFQQQII